MKGISLGPHAPPASTGPVKTFANLRRLDPELALAGKFGKDFTRAQTLLERALTEAKQGMVGEAAVSC